MIGRGERFVLGAVGNHWQGTMFRDGGRLSSPALDARVDEIARQVPGFFIGRFGVRYSDPDRFRAGEADVDVLRFDVDVCGIVEESGDQRFLTAGGDRYLLADGAEPDAGQRVCASGRLDDRSDPPRLALASVQSGGS